MTTGIDVYWENGDVDFGPYDFIILQAYDGASGLKADAHGMWFARNADGTTLDLNAQMVVDGFAAPYMVAG